MRDPYSFFRRPPHLATRTFILPLCAIACLCVSVSHAAPAKFPKKLTILDSAKVQHGYFTIYTSPPQKTVYLLNNKGDVVHEWGNPDGPGTLPIGEVVKPAPNGGILTYLRVDPSDSKRRRIVELSYVGDIVWEYFNPDIPTLNHDFQRLPNGNLLLLGSRVVSAPHIAPGDIKDDVIFEVNRTGNIVWSWSTVDHFNQLQYPDETIEIIKNKEIVPQNDQGDIFHTNSIQSLPPNPAAESDLRFSKGNILVSQRNTNLVFVIDKATGNVVWRMRKKSIGQHHVKMIPWSLPGAGNILMFDNGGWAGYPRVYRFHSRVLEIDPLTKNVQWEYTPR